MAASVDRWTEEDRAGRGGFRLGPRGMVVEEKPGSLWWRGLEDTWCAGGEDGRFGRFLWRRRIGEFVVLGLEVTLVLVERRGVIREGYGGCLGYGGRNRKVRGMLLKGKGR